MCAEQDSAPYKFLKTQTRTQLRVVEGIANNADMFWRFEQAGNKGKFGLRTSETCQAVVYDWPLLQGYINLTEYVREYM